MLTSSGRRVLSDSSPSPVCSESQRSDPRGSVTVAGAAVSAGAAPSASAGALGAGVDDSGRTTSLVSSPVSSTATRVYGLLPTHASTSVVGPNAAKTSPSPRATVSWRPGCALSVFPLMTV
jgi:hypothetical protein